MMNYGGDGGVFKYRLRSIGYAVSARGAVWSMALKRRCGRPLIAERNRKHWFRGASRKGRGGGRSAWNYIMKVMPVSSVQEV